MRYVRYTVLMLDQRMLEYAKSYRNDAKMPPCPHHWNILQGPVAHISAEFCTYEEKYRISRRGDQRMVRDIIEHLEAATAIDPIGELAKVAGVSRRAFLAMVQQK